MNRKTRRELEKKKVLDKADPETTFSLGYKLDVPGGLLRSDHPATIAGRLDANNEADLMRGVFVKMMESFGFITQERAVVGLLAALVNPFPKHLRGALAYAIVQGQGFIVDKDMVEVCSYCEQEKLETVDLQEMPAEDACQYGDGVFPCDAAPDENVHDQDSPEWDHDFEEPEVVMLDTTQHTPNCPTLTLLPDGTENPQVEEKKWKEVEAVVVLTPRMYEPLQVDQPEETPEPEPDYEEQVDIDEDGNVVKEAEPEAEQTDE